MKKYRLFTSFYFWTKLLSFCSAIAGLTSLLLPKGMLLSVVCMVGACAMLILLPIGAESAAMSFVYACTIALFVLIYALFRRFGFVMLVLILSGTFLALTHRCRERYSTIRPLFNKQAILYNTHNHTRLLLSYLLCFLALIGSPDCLIMRVSSFVLLLLLYGLILYKSFTGRTIILTSKKEKELRNLINGELNPYCSPAMDTDSSPDTSGMSDLFERVGKLMEESRPYLDENYSIQELAKAVYTNKTYLSRTINVCSGLNFRKFINQYRVLYSISLMESDHHLRVLDLAEQSGFSTVVTYNMAFKAMTNTTPGEYYQRVRSGLMTRGGRDIISPSKYSAQEP